MDAAYVLRGFALGFSIAAPVGQIGVLCIRRTLADGRLNGFVSGLGAATADACYGSVAAFGLTAISDILNQNIVQAIIHIFGSLFLFYLGIKILRSIPAPIESSSTTVSRRGLFGAYASTVVLTLTNPTTIFMFLGVFAGLRIGAGAGDYLSALLLVIGVFSGSATWWFILSGGVGLLRTRINTAMLRAVNVLSGLIIIGFGIYSLITLFNRA